VVALFSLARPAFARPALGAAPSPPQATFKGLIQSDTTCSASLEERDASGTLPAPFRHPSDARLSSPPQERINPNMNLMLSGQLNHKKKDYKFGFGVVIGAA
jgi:hypothetical protein